MGFRNSIPINILIHSLKNDFSTLLYIYIVHLGIILFLGNNNLFKFNVLWIEIWWNDDNC